MKSHRVRKTTRRREKGWKQLQCWYLHELQSFARFERREGGGRETIKREVAKARVAQTRGLPRHIAHTGTLNIAYCISHIAHCTHRYIAHCILHIAYCTHRHIAYCTSHIAHTGTLHNAHCILHIAHRHIAHCSIGAGTPNNAFAQVQTQGLRSGSHICFVFVQRRSFSILCL